MKVTLTVNGRKAEADVAPRTSLADFVREHLHLTGTHIGCEHGVCGACTVSINGETARSCITYAVQCDGASVATIEGFADDPLMARLRQAFKEEHALQCGYCTPGMLVAARDLIRRKGGLDEAQIRREMSGNLCRCTGYVGIVRAIGRVMAEREPLVGHLPAPARHLGSLPGELATASVHEAKLGPAERSPTAAPAAPSLAEWLPLDAFDAARAQRIEESIHIAAPRAVVWERLGDIEQVAACLPGATLLGRDGRSDDGDGERFTGRVSVKIGPMVAAFAGRGLLSREAATWSGTVDGQGEAKDSGSRLRGRMSYRLAEDGADRTRITISIAYALTGPLAQFSRGDIVRDLVRQIAKAFASNLEARVNGGPARALPAAELNAVDLVLRALWSQIRRLFGRSG